MEYYKIGRIVSTFGKEGDIVVDHGLGIDIVPKALDVIFIEDNSETLLPWFIQKLQLRGNKAFLLHLEEVNSIDEAKKLINKNVWIQEKNFNQLKTNSPIYLLNFALFSDGEKLGEITEVIEQKYQVICAVIIRGKEALIPLNEQTIERIDREKKEVHVHIPDGLLEVYLGEE